MLLCGEASGDDFHGCGVGDGGGDDELPLGEAGGVFGDFGEAEFGVVVDDEGVAIGGDVGAGEFGDAEGACVVEDFSKDHVLDFAAEDAAAHEPGVDGPTFFCGGFRLIRRIVGADDDDADHAVVAEDVGETDLKSEDVRIVFCLEDFRFGVAAGG